MNISITLLLGLQ